MIRRVRSPAVRFAAFVLPVVVLPAAILAVLGYYSLRQWERSAETLFHAQARDLAIMTAEKVAMVLRRAEDEAVAHLQSVLAGPKPTLETLGAFVASTPLIAGLSIFDRRGRLRYPPVGQAVDGGAFPTLSREFPPEEWVKPGVRHLALPDPVILAAVPKGPGGEALLAVLPVDPEALRPRPAGDNAGLPRGAHHPAVLDAHGRLVYARAPLEQANPIVSVPLGGTFPAWRLTLYQAPGTAPQDAVRRQVVLVQRGLWPACSW